MNAYMSLFGILNVNKPAGCTSRDVVNQVERLIRPQRVGHAGTLDPLATGVLVICVGQATRLVQYVHQFPKRYSGTFLLGRRSQTDDVEGEVVEMAHAQPPSRNQLEDVLPQFLGELEQRPPAHSAVKIAGKRAYHLARRGKTVELPLRKVTIHRLTVRRYEYPELELEIECGSGTYVRALGRDLATALGTSAVMSALERTAIGPFQIQNALPITELKIESLDRHLQPALIAVADMPRVVLCDAECTEIRHGRPIDVRLLDSNDLQAEIAAVGQSGTLVAILRQKRSGQLWPVKNFLTAD